VTAFIEDRSVLTRAARAVDTTFSYGSDPSQLIDIRYGVAGADRKPWIVMVHGGFWRPEYDRVHTGPMCEALAAAGWHVAAIEYRRIPGAPDDMVADVRAAIGALVERSNGRCIVVGHSAGGHLCLYLAATLQERALIGALALAPVADLRLAEHLNLDDGAVRDFLGCAARARTDLDPAQLHSPRIATTLLHGREDAIVPLSLSQSYMEHHPSARLVTLDRCGHFAVIDPQSAAWAALLAELDRLSQ
jgi:pimeloyl-ACP methyl ester carboxylesterase